MRDDDHDVPVPWWSGEPGVRTGVADDDRVRARAGRRARGEAPADVIDDAGGAGADGAGDPAAGGPGGPNGPGGRHAPGRAAPGPVAGPAGGPGDHADDPGEGPRRSRAQIFVPAPEDLPPPETVFGPSARRRAAGPGGPVRAPGADRPGGPVPPGGATGAAGIPGPAPRPRRPGGPAQVPGPGPGPVGAPDPDAGGSSTVPAPFGGPLRDPEPLPGRGSPADPYGVPEPGPMVAPHLADDVPDAPVLTPGVDDLVAEPDLLDEPDRPAPDPGRPARARRPAVDEPRPRRPPIDRHRLRTVYDIDGPRVRLGLAWFVGVMLATIVPLPGIAAIVYAVAAGWAARQIVQAWGSVSWQADVAAGLGAVPVLAALVGTPAVVGAVVVALVVAAGCAVAPDGARLPGGEGRIATVGILVFSMVPALAGAMFVLVWRESAVAAAVLLLVASAYEMGDYIVGSGASNPVEGPLAGITTASLVALPLAIVLVEPYAAAGVGLLALTAVACPLGQILGSAALPGAGAHAPALRRIDTLLVLGPMWAAAAGAF